MKFSTMFKKAEKFLVDNSTLILSASAISGVVMTGILTSKATYKAALILEAMDEEATHKEKFKAVWYLYIQAISVAATTITCIIMANRISTKRATALAAAYSLSERVIEEYKEKVIEKIGANEERKIHDSIAQDRMVDHPIGKQEVIVTGGGDVLCYDMYSGRYFKSSMEELKKAQNDLNYNILNNFYASLNDFYDRLGLSHIKTGDEFGWNSDQMIELVFSTTMSDDQRPCISIDFSVSPIRNYFRTH